MGNRLNMGAKEKMRPLSFPPKKSHQSKELTNNKQESISFSDPPSAAWQSVFNGSNYTGYVGFRNEIYARGISDNIISSYNINGTAWDQDTSQATASVIGVSATNIYLISVDQESIYKNDPTPWSTIWTAPTVPRRSTRIKALNLINGGDSIYCIFSDGSISRYDDASGQMVPMTNNMPSNLTFNNNFIGVSTYLVGLTSETGSPSGAPYIRGPNESDTWEPIGSPIYSYLFGGGNSIYLASILTSDPQDQYDCTSYNLDTGLWNPLNSDGLDGAYPPLFVSMANQIDYCPSIIAISTTNDNTYLWIPFGQKKYWLSVNQQLPTASPQSFQVILPGGNLPNFCIGYVPVSSNSTVCNYWVLVNNGFWGNGKLDLECQ